MMKITLLSLLFLLLSILHAQSHRMFWKRQATGTDGCPFSQLGNTASVPLQTACGVLGPEFCNSPNANLSILNEVRPETNYTFQEPDTTANPPDQRGPCPGLNLLANYGYLPRNGIISFDQAIGAAVRGFNMGVDIATALATFAVVFDGNIDTEMFSIGGPDRRVKIGDIGGLSRHGTIENDISPFREDSYLGGCDNHDLSSRLFKQGAQFAKDEGGNFTYNAMKRQFVQNANYSKANNPYLFYSPLSAVITTATHMFYATFFANGTYGFGGVPNYESISTIAGAKLITNGNYYYFKYIAERWPEVRNAVGRQWYRRGTPFTFAELLPLAIDMLSANPTLTPLPLVSNSTMTPQTLGCALYQQVLEFTPIAFAESVQNVALMTTYLISKLDPIFNNTVFGCPANSFSNNNGSYPAYPYTYQSGTPTNPVPASCSPQSNVYNKPYFCNPPK